MSELVYRGAKIHFEGSGKGRKVPLILLHGFLEDSEIWNPIVKVLSRERQVICIDLPGHGRSEGISKEHSMSLMAEVVLKVMKDLQIHEVSMAGHSMGGYISLEFMKNFPTLLKSVVLINSTPLEDTVEKKKIRERSVALVGKNKDAFISMALTNLFPEQSKVKFATEIEKLKARALEMKAENVQAALICMKNRTNYVEDLKRFQNQKFIVAGKEDPILDFKGLKDVSAQCNCRFFEMEYGHNSWMEERNRLLEIMLLID